MAHAVYMQTELEYPARFPESLYEPLIDRKTSLSKITFGLCWSYNGYQSGTEGISEDVQLLAVGVISTS